MCKISIIGAGSYFTLRLIGDFFRLRDLWGSNIVLYDINKRILKTMYKIIYNNVLRENVDLDISFTTNIKEALENSDFVIITIRVGGSIATENIIKIPMKYGVRQVVGDTTGPSGILKGLLEIPVILDIATMLEDLSTRAIILNFTNPITPIGMAVSKGTSIRIIGLCHGINHIRVLASKLLKIDLNNIYPVAGGINHLTWCTSLRYSDKDILENFIEKIFSKKSESILEEHPYIIGRQLLKIYGNPPVLNDRHTSEFFSCLYRWFKDPKIGKILRKVSGIIDYKRKTLRRDWIEERNRKWIYLERMLKGSYELEIKPSNEYAIDIISSIVNDRRRDLLAVNILNNNYIDVPSWAYVEVPAIVDGYGVHGIKVGKISDAILTILRLHIDKYRLLVDGILERDRDLVIQALALDPLTPSPADAEKIFNDFINVSQKFLSIKFN